LPFFEERRKGIESNFAVPDHPVFGYKQNDQSDGDQQKLERSFVSGFFFRLKTTHRVMSRIRMGGSRFGNPAPSDIRPSRQVIGQSILGLCLCFGQIRTIRAPYQSDLNSHQSLARRLYLILWIALATVHLTQSVWISGWTDVPSTSGDGQLNNMLLEHGFQALRGVYPFSSPGQFYPVEGTLAYSDAHWGTLPVYAAARTLGFSVWTAFQVWAVVLAAANGFAVLYLTRVCRIPWVLAGPICFIGAIGTGSGFVVCS